MTISKLIQALNGLKVETGSLACMGCGHEHNCSTHGCAILLEAIDTLSGFEWIDPKVELPPEDVVVLVVVDGKPGPNLTLEDAYEFASYSKDEGWILEAYPEWEDAVVKKWMNIPEVQYET